MTPLLIEMAREACLYEAWQAFLSDIPMEWIKA